MAKPRRYRVLTKTEAEKLEFHNLKRLMNKVRTHIGFWENTTVNWGDIHDYEKIVQENLSKHRNFFEMLRGVSKNHPHKNSPKLKKISF